MGLATFHTPPPISHQDKGYINWSHWEPLLLLLFLICNVPSDFLVKKKQQKKTSVKLKKIIRRIEKQDKGWVYRFDLSFCRPMALYSSVDRAAGVFIQASL